ncbi:YfhE family protein [Peribacillus saganii]|nr:YfhE family protein [Peribacillus saganii]
MENKKKEKIKHTLSSAQEVTYAHEFKAADRAAGFMPKKHK